MINVPAKKEDFYIKLLPESLHSFIMEMEPVTKAVKKTKSEPAKKKGGKRIKLSLYPGISSRLCIVPIVEEYDSISDIFDDGRTINLNSGFSGRQLLYNSSQSSICVYFYSSTDGIKYSITNGRGKRLGDRDIIIESVCDYIYDEETSATTEEIIAEISEDNEDFSLIEKMNMASEIANPMSKEVYKDIKDLHNLRDDDECVIFIIDAIKRRMKQVAEQLVNDGLAEDVESVRFALEYTQFDETICSYMIETKKFEPEKLRIIVCDDWFDWDVSRVLGSNLNSDRLLSNIIYDGKFYELCDSVYFNKYTEYDIVDCNLQSLE